MKRILLVLLVVLLSLGSLLIAVEINTFNKEHYLENYKSHNQVAITGKSLDELMEITDDLLIYLKGKAGDEILEANFNRREVLHMRDVQVLFKIGYILKYMSIILSIAIIVYFIKKREIVILGKYIYRGLFFNWIILALLGLLIYSDFNKYFTYFHYIFFTNDLWLLNPATDLLIQMLPEEFFSSMATSIGVSFFIIVAIIQGIGYVLVRKGRGKGEKDLKLFKKIE
ncbi:MAG: TIGR01906 family membrane protein [Tissierellia bacterium]|nr:TIGR01906 family membrane protein [Tissierellia bacterium]